MYYQAWLLFSVAGAYGIYYLISNRPHLSVERPNFLSTSQAIRSVVFFPIIVVFVAAGLLYPYAAIQSRYISEVGRRDNPNQAPLTLDGSTTISQDEVKVAQCLAKLEPQGSPAVLAEAPFEGGYNSTYGRISMLTGIPTLMGWRNHESQWRGASFDLIDNGAGYGQRFTDADLLFKTTTWSQAQDVIDRYGIDYVVIGNAERVRYTDDLSGLEKFGKIFDPVCQSGSTAIYNVSAE